MQLSTVDCSCSLYEYTLSVSRSVSGKTHVRSSSSSSCFTVVTVISPPPGYSSTKLWLLMSGWYPFQFKTRTSVFYSECFYLAILCRALNYQSALLFSTIFPPCSLYILTNRPSLVSPTPSLQLSRLTQYGGLVETKRDPGASSCWRQGSGGRLLFSQQENILMPL